MEPGVCLSQITAAEGTKQLDRAPGMPQQRVVTTAQILKRAERLADLTGKRACEVARDTLMSWGEVSAEFFGCLVQSEHASKANTQHFLPPDNLFKIIQVIA